jgi:N-methylhydantoinase B/oxoprolinase/acetone carboxylase alpha subunit
MSKNRIKALLAQLQDEIRNTDMDDELKTLVSDLDSDIHSVIDNDEEVNALIDRAKEVEAGFATRYPAAERFMREVIDALVRMGI